MVSDSTRLLSGAVIRAAESLLTNELTEKLGYAFALWLAKRLGTTPDRLSVSVGHDSRPSGPRLQHALIDGLTAALKERSPMDAVKEYRATLETAGMRLAHYWGYLLGNDILPRCIPGYRPDITLDLRYRRMLETHFGRAS